MMYLKNRKNRILKGKIFFLESWVTDEILLNLGYDNTVKQKICRPQWKSKFSEFSTRWVSGAGSRDEVLKSHIDLVKISQDKNFLIHLTSEFLLINKANLPIRCGNTCKNKFCYSTYYS